MGQLMQRQRDDFRGSWPKDGDDYTPPSHRVITTPAPPANTARASDRRKLALLIARDPTRA
jgi:hypothetical protein